MVLTRVDSGVVLDIVMNNDDIVSVGRSGIVGATGTGNAISSFNSSAINTRVFVDGEVYSADTAINLFAQNQYVSVGETGIVRSFAVNFFSKAAIRFVGDSNELINAGEIHGPTGVISDVGSLRLINTGLISGEGYGVSLREIPDSLSAGTILNHGEILSLNVGIIVFDGATTITNTGLISGHSSALSLSDGDDVVTNLGTMVGRVTLGSGDDIFDTSQGTVAGTIRGGSGNDLLIGSVFNDVLEGGTGADEFRGGAGEDWVVYDLGSAFGAGEGVTVSLSRGKGFYNEAAGDRLSGIENVRGTRSDDRLFGDDNDNRLDGDEGNDFLSGQGGNDIISGGSGNDTIFGRLGDDRLDGGLGRDVIEGGSGEDVFVVSELFQFSGIFFQERDIITDFTQGEDLIDLAALESDYGLTLQLVGLSGFSGVAGEVRYVRDFKSNETRVQLDADGDQDADLVVVLRGGTFNLTVDDFVF